MQPWSSTQKSSAATIGIAIIILGILISIDHLCLGTDWLPQVVVSLAGFAGASWFVGRRLDLLDKGILQRQEAAAELLLATERGNLNGAVKEAVNMLSNGSLPSALAGQRWLHQIALVGPEEAGLVRDLLCSYIASSGQSSDSPDNDPLDADSRIKPRQSALNLLFGDPGKERYVGCKDAADLGSVQWKGLDFADLDLTKTIFSGGDFTGANVTGACFERSNLRRTQWASTFGGNTRTRMDNAEMYSVSALSCIFHNISFRGAKMGTNGPQSKFIYCKFENCDFEGADWTGAFFDTPQFDDECKGLTFELCRHAKLKDPFGLPSDVLEQLNRRGLLKE